MELKVVYVLYSWYQHGRVFVKAIINLLKLVLTSCNEESCLNVTTVDLSRLQVFTSTLGTNIFWPLLKVIFENKKSRTYVTSELYQIYYTINHKGWDGRRSVGGCGKESHNFSLRAGLGGEALAGG